MYFKLINLENYKNIVFNKRIQVKQKKYGIREKIAFNKVQDQIKTMKNKIKSIILLFDNNTRVAFRLALRNPKKNKRFDESTCYKMKYLNKPFINKKKKQKRP